MFIYKYLLKTNFIIQPGQTILLSGAGTTNPQNYFRTVMEYLTVESKLPVNTYFGLNLMWVIC